MAKTAAVLIIGNEILSGKIRDENSPYLARELRALGVDLRAIDVVPDEIELISEKVALFSKTYDFVFTSGGVGPTHDDVTMRGVAEALGRGTEINPKMAEFLTAKCGVKDQKAVQRLAELPEGAELIEIEDMRFLPVRVENIYVFPGVPEYLRQKFEALKERFRGEPFSLKRVFVNEEEYCIASQVDKVDEAFPDVMIGSYPKINENDHKVVLTLEARDTDMLEKALEMLLESLPDGSVVRTE